MHRGSCLCGAVTFQVAGDLPPPSACHCSLCRKWTGHYEVSTDVARSALTIDGSESIKWYQSSAKVRRGFCANCGASLFFDPLDQAKHNWIGVSMGAFAAPTHTQLKMHIFVADKGDYYEIADGLPQNQQ
ncbi:MAG: GFA family protein [Deltaproteobacteria bacterium]|nr:GFA family protein [Deltaproteobacteria bacterium]